MERKGKNERRETGRGGGGDLNNEKMRELAIRDDALPSAGA